MKFSVGDLVYLSDSYFDKKFVFDRDGYELTLYEIQELIGDHFTMLPVDKSKSFIPGIVFTNERDLLRQVDIEVHHVIARRICDGFK